MNKCDECVYLKHGGDHQYYCEKEDELTEDYEKNCPFYKVYWADEKNPYEREKK